MRHSTLFIFTLVILACSSQKQDPKRNTTSRLTHSFGVTDSCLQTLYIDKHSLETRTFKKLWDNARALGYTFSEDTTGPFVKIIFQPRSSRFYNDTLKISSCTAFDSVNIHKIEIRSTKAIDKIYYTNLRVEEWQFKNSTAAKDYANALTYFYKAGYGVKSPTSVVLTNSSVYIFQTAAFMFITEMEKLEKTLDTNLKKYVTNY